jgi:hypothetical protein
MPMFAKHLGRIKCWRPEFNAIINKYFLEKSKLHILEGILLLIIPLYIWLSLSNHIPNFCVYLLAAVFLIMTYIFRHHPSQKQNLWEILISKSLPLVTLIVFVISIWSIYHIGDLKIFPDTGDYIKHSVVNLSNMDFWLCGHRLFVTPLILKIFHRDWAAINVFFIIIYLLSAFLFIMMITRFFPKPREKVLASYVFLMFFLNQSFMSLWLICALSETPAIVLTLALLSSYGFSFLYKNTLNNHKGRTLFFIALNVLVIFLFSFSRDTNLYFLPCLALFYFLIFKEIKYKIAISFFILAIFFLHSTSLKHSDRWKLPLGNVVMRGIIPNEELRQLFQIKYHLPPDELIMPCSGKFAYEDVPNKNYIVNFQSDNKNSQPQDWVSRYGMQAYKNYLLTHPGNIIAGWIDEWDIYNSNLWHYTQTDDKANEKKLNSFLFGFPGSVSFFAAILIFLFGILYIKENPLVLLAFFHAAVIGIISYAGDATEWGRHYQQASMTLKIAFLLFILHAYSKIMNSEFIGSRSSDSNGAENNDLSEEAL